MKTKVSRFLQALGFLALFVVCLSSTFAQEADSIYFRNFVRHADGSYCTHTPPTATFTCYLNGDQSRVLIENAPRWNPLGDPNINGNGMFGVELGNFTNPGVQVGDTVSIRFTCTATGQEGTLIDVVTAIPWNRLPLALTLSIVSLPVAPQNVTLWVDSLTYFRTVIWTDVGGVTYSVYRRTLEDTLRNGRSRMLYTRLVTNLSGGSFTDTTALANENYGYIVYAVSSTGTVSAHSEELNEVLGRITNLAVTPRATTTILSWNRYDPPINKSKGYNIYRRTSGGIYGSPLAYTGLDTTFIDSRLSLGTTYYYKVKARSDYPNEIASSEEVVVTTLPSQSGFYTYANLKVAVVIYKNTTRGSISNSEVANIQTMLDVGKLFYWRNSLMKLNVEFTYFPIDSLRDFGDPGNTNVGQTVVDLESLGVVNTQYDIIFRVSPATAGYWSYGVLDLGLPGPSRQTGFSHSEWPVGTGVIYPGHLPGINYGLTWIFVHEVQHPIDAVYAANGHTEMYHGDVPWEFPVACGEHYDFQGKIFRTFNAYEDLLPTWGNIYEAVDADGDGLPDAESLVGLDEARFGSNPSSPDTDTDGYTDKQEATDGDYAGSDPAATDTDQDGILDGQDVYPRYPVQTVVQPFTPTIDGVIEAGWQLVDDTVCYTQVGYSPRLYMGYDTTWLYVGLFLPHIGFPELTFDFQTDGWWWGAGNTQLSINIVYGTFLVHSWDASPEVREYSLSRGGPGGMWDDDPEYISHFNRRVIYPDSVQLAVTLAFPVVQIELAIHKRPYAGLLLNPGDSLALNVRYTKVNNDPYQWATTFDQYDFARVVLGATTHVENQTPTTSLLKRFALEQNWPNPFNPKTEIQYAIAEGGVIDLTVYNVLGQHVRTLINTLVPPGVYTASWDARDGRGKEVSSGIYIYRLMTSQGESFVRKMMLIR